MTQKPYKKLRQQSKLRLQKALKSLLANDIEDANEHIAWYEASSKLLSWEDKALKIKWSKISTCLCAIIVGILFTLRISWTHLSIDATIGNLALTLSEKWICNHRFIMDEIYLDNVEIDSQKESTSLYLSGKNITLSNLTIQNGAEIDISVNEKETDFYIKEGEISGIIYVRDAKSIIETDSDRIERLYSLHDPDTPSKSIRFQSKNVGTVPTRLHMVNGSDWRLQGIKTTRLETVEEYPPSTGNFESVIKHGTIKIMETGLEKKLSSSDFLKLKNLKSRLIEVVNSDEGVHVFFEGQAGSVFTGPKDYQNNITPTYLEYCYHQQKLKMYWIAMLFTVGIFWKLRNAWKIN